MHFNPLRIGMIGVGMRGMSLLKDLLSIGDTTCVTALCDTSTKNLQKAQTELVAHGRPEAFLTESYQVLLQRDDVDAVIIATGWDTHVQIACEAMENGKIVGCEVAGSYSLEECWRLVHTYEKTRTPIMLLENCCYGRDELMLLQMRDMGALGEIVHCQGGYRHDIRTLCIDDCDIDHFRLRHFATRCCDYYPTHDLGPIAKLLNIGHGNRMVSLVSVASKAVGLTDYALRKNGTEDAKSRLHIKQGDVITTIIKCAGGETIVLTLDTTLPRFYSRGLQVQGTRAMYCEENRSLFIESEHNAHEGKWSVNWGNVENYREAYEHPVWQDFLKKKEQGGHGGMDRLMLEAFIQAVQTQAPMPIDIYDMADWKSVTLLSEQSILAGGMPQFFPDFRNGQWIMG